MRGAWDRFDCFCGQHTDYVKNNTSSSIFLGDKKSKTEKLPSVVELILTACCMPYYIIPKLKYFRSFLLSPWTSFANYKAFQSFCKSWTWSPKIFKDFVFLIKTLVRYYFGRPIIDMILVRLWQNFQFWFLNRRLIITFSAGILVPGHLRTLKLPYSIQNRQKSTKKYSERLIWVAPKGQDCNFDTSVNLTIVKLFWFFGFGADKSWQIGNQQLDRYTIVKLIVLIN